MSRRTIFLTVIMLLSLSAIVCNLGVTATEPPPPTDTPPPPVPTDTPVPADTETPPEEPAAQTVVFVVNNSSDSDICYLYLSPSDSTDWGADQLGEDIIPAGGSFPIEDVPPGTYDVLFEACDPDVEPLEEYGLNINEDFEYTLVSVETAPPGPGDTLFATEFDDLDNWSMATYPPNLDHIAEIRAGKLYIEVPQAGTSVYAFFDDEDLGSADVRIHATVELVAGPNFNNISLVCRRTSAGFYDFSMDSGGFWTIYKNEGQNFFILADGGSTAINMQKARNELVAVCDGNTLKFFINDVEVGSVVDTSYPSGGVGVGVTTFDIPGAGVEFDDFFVTVP